MCDAQVLGCGAQALKYGGLKVADGQKYGGLKVADVVLKR